MNSKDRPKKVWLPRGIVIPWEIGGELWRLNVRRPDEDLKRDKARGIKNLPKYIGPAGCSNALYNADALNTGLSVIMVEGELDALTIAQAADDLIVPVATDSTHGSRRMRWIARLALVPLVLVAFDAEPEKGDKAADWWVRGLANAKRWRPFWGDANAMAQEGADVRAWVESGLAVFSPDISAPGPERVTERVALVDLPDYMECHALVPEDLDWSNDEPVLKCEHRSGR